MKQVLDTFESSFGTKAGWEVSKGVWPLEMVNFKLIEKKQKKTAKGGRKK